MYEKVFREHMNTALQEHTCLHKDWLFLCAEGHLCFAFVSWDVLSTGCYSEEGLGGVGSNPLWLGAAPIADNVIPSPPPDSFCLRLALSSAPQWRVSFHARVFELSHTPTCRQADGVSKHFFFVCLSLLLYFCRSSVTFWKPSKRLEGGGGTNRPRDCLFHWQPSHSVLLDQKQRAGLVFLRLAYLLLPSAGVASQPS